MKGDNSAQKEVMYCCNKEVPEDCRHHFTGLKIVFMIKNESHNQSITCAYAKHTMYKVFSGLVASRSGDFVASIPLVETSYLLPHVPFDVVVG